MFEKPVFALMYDFDKTLSPRDMQEYGFIPEIKMRPEEFWEKCNSEMRKNRMDQILAYMYVMVREAKGKMLFTRETLRALGNSVSLFPGVSTWFQRVNTYVEKKGMIPEHYIISSGLKEIIEGTSIAGEFREIYAAEFCYDEHGEPCWPAMAVNFTSKTQFLYRINKGVTDTLDNTGINEYMPEDKRRVPFRNMVYIGDGLTDVPCMKIVRVNGGHSIAVYGEDEYRVSNLILDGRADYALPADYSEGSLIEKTVFAIIDQAAAANITVGMHMESLDRAHNQREEEKRRLWEKSLQAPHSSHDEIASDMDEGRIFMESPVGLLEICSQNGAIVGVSFVKCRGEERTSQICRLAETQLKEYFAGERKIFQLPLEPEGTEFQKSVWKELSRIPYGETRSYKDIAKALGKSSAVRAVGGANNKNPIAIIIPCHRVIGAGGELVGYSGGLDIKRKLLDMEVTNV